jgi:hypothetical protein
MTPSGLELRILSQQDSIPKDTTIEPSGNGHDKRILGQKPSKSKLARRHPLLLRHSGQTVDELQILMEVFGLIFPHQCKSLRDRAKCSKVPTSNRGICLLKQSRRCAVSQLPNPRLHSSGLTGCLPRECRWENGVCPSASHDQEA